MIVELHSLHLTEFLVTWGQQAEAEHNTTETFCISIFKVDGELVSSQQLQKNIIIHFQLFLTNWRMHVQYSPRHGSLKFPTTTETNIWTFTC